MISASEYKRITTAPDAFSFLQLQATRRILESVQSPLAGVIDSFCLDHVEIPALYSGERYMQFYRVSASQQQASEIVQALLELEAGAVSPEGDTTNLASQLAAFVDKWSRYENHVSNK